MNLRSLLETLTITLGAMLVSLVLFGVFIFAYTLLLSGQAVDPRDLYYWIYKGGSDRGPRGWTR